MASCTPANTAPNRLPRRALRRWSPTEGWPQSRSCCCWRSPFVRPFACSIPNWFVAIIFPCARSPGSCTARSGSRRQPVHLSGVSLPSHPSPSFFFFHSSTESGRVFSFAALLTLSRPGACCSWHEKRSANLPDTPLMPLCRLDKLLNDH